MPTTCLLQSGGSDEKAYIAMQMKALGHDT